MPEVTGKRILGKYDSKDGPVYLTNYGTGVLKIDEAPKKMVEEWKKVEKRTTVDDSYTYKIEDEREPKAEGGAMKFLKNFIKDVKQQERSSRRSEDGMNQSLLESQDFSNDIGFPSATRQSSNQTILGNNMRQQFKEGSLMVPPEMEGMESDMPEDTYPNIPPEEMAEAEASQLPDSKMEDNYMDFVLTESLDDTEQTYLMNALETDEKLSQIFDKVITTASEFSGAGEVEGPGTGVSDSIPARLSDGEFVFTKKATDQMGADQLQTMMDEAEKAYDGGVMRKPAREGGSLLYKGKDEDPLSYEKIAQDEIKKGMLRSNRAPSLNPG